MLNKCFKFLKGYVIIEVSGLYAERFINICTRRGLEISDIKPLCDRAFEMRISKKDFKKIRSVAYKTKTRVKIKKRCGAYEIWKKGRGRYFFFIGAAVFVTFFAAASRFIWAVEIDGTENSDKNRLMEQLRENGVYVGAKKSRIGAISELKNRILFDNDSIAWLWVYIEGSKARVEVYEKVIPPETVDIKQPCDVIASYDGVVEKIENRRGYTAVKANTVVEAGDVLISGTVPVYKEGYEEKYISVHAEGDVYARTVHKKTKIYPKYYEARYATGNEFKRYSLDLFSKTVCFYRDEEIPYKSYDEKKKRYEFTIPVFGFTGIALNVCEYSQVNINREPISNEYVEEKARYELEQEIARELMPGARLMESEIQSEEQEDGSLKITLSMTFTEQIGITRRVDILDSQTNRGD